MYDIIYDESGKLLSGVFYQFNVQFADDFLNWETDYDRSWIVATRNPTDDELRGRGQPGYMWCEVLGDWSGLRAQRRCPLNREHITEAFYGPYAADLAGWSRLTEFVPDSSRIIVVTDQFASRMKASGLTGLRFETLKINVNQSSREPAPTLFVVEFTGRNCLRPKKVNGVADACPWCGHGPLICPACGSWMQPCSQCSKMTMVLAKKHEGEGDKRLRHAPTPRKGEVLEGARWDGSDFVNCLGRIFMTRRAVDWLLSVHATPFHAISAQVNVDGLGEQQMAKIEAARSLSSLKQ